VGGPDDEERPGVVRAGDRPVDVGRDLGVPGMPERETALPRMVRHAAAGEEVPLAPPVRLREVRRAHPPDEPDPLRFREGRPGLELAGQAERGGAVDRESRLLLGREPDRVEREDREQLAPGLGIPGELADALARDRLDADDGRRPGGEPLDDLPKPLRSRLGAERGQVRRSDDHHLPGLAGGRRERDSEGRERRDPQAARARGGETETGKACRHRFLRRARGGPSHEGPNRHARTRSETRG
jgi:hypothetical protein